MTEADDNVVELRDLDQLFEDVLAGQALGPEAPAWSADLARLVRGARAEAVPGELAGHDADRRQHARGAAGGRGRRATPRRATALPRRACRSRRFPPHPTGRPHPRRGRERGRAPVPRHVRGERGYRAKHAADPHAGVGQPDRPQRRPADRPEGRGGDHGRRRRHRGCRRGHDRHRRQRGRARVHEQGTRHAPGVQDHDPAAPRRGGAGGDDDEDLDATVPVPACQLAPVCSPLTPAGPGSDDPVPAPPPDRPCRRPSGPAPRPRPPSPRRPPRRPRHPPPPSPSRRRPPPRRRRRPSPSRGPRSRRPTPLPDPLRSGGSTRRSRKSSEACNAGVLPRDLEGAIHSLGAGELVGRTKLPRRKPSGVRAVHRWSTARSRGRAGDPGSSRARDLPARRPGAAVHRRAGPLRAGRGVGR